MKFLIDNCAGRVLAEWLRGQGHDAVRVRDRRQDPGDPAILRWAVEEDRVLVTMDKNFGTLIYRDRLRHAGVIRLPQCSVTERVEHCARIPERHAAELPGAIVTVRGDVIRLAPRVEPDD